jgi:hypothetical protein
MIFSALKEFRMDLVKSLDDVKQFFTTEFSATLRELRTGLYKLRFNENFECFVAQLTLEAGQELSIPNQLTQVPAWWVLLRSNEAGLSVCDGDTEWNTGAVSLKNTSASVAQITVAFFK